MTKLPSAVPSLTDWHTWIAILTSAAAIATVVFHEDYSVYVPLAAILVAGVINAVLMIVKHNYAKALIAGANAIDAASTVAPSNLASELQTAMKVADAVAQIQAAFQPVTVAPTTTVTTAATENSANVAPGATTA